MKKALSLILVLGLILAYTPSAAAFDTMKANEILDIHNGKTFMTIVDNSELVTVKTETLFDDHMQIEYESLLSGRKTEISETLYNNGNRDMFFYDTITGMSNEIIVRNGRVFVDGNEAAIVIEPNGTRNNVPTPDCFVATDGPEPGATYSVYSFTQRYNVHLGQSYASLLLDSFLTIFGLLYPPCQPLTDAISITLEHYWTYMLQYYEDTNTAYVLAHVYTTSTSLDPVYEYYMFKNYFFNTADYDMQIAYTPSYCYLDPYISG